MRSRHSTTSSMIVAPVMTIRRVPGAFYPHSRRRQAAKPFGLEVRHQRGQRLIELRAAQQDLLPVEVRGRPSGECRRRSARERSPPGGRVRQSGCRRVGNDLRGRSFGVCNRATRSRTRELPALAAGSVFPSTGEEACAHVRDVLGTDELQRPGVREILTLPGRDPRHASQSGFATRTSMRHWSGLPADRSRSHP